MTTANTTDIQSMDINIASAGAHIPASLTDSARPPTNVLATPISPASAETIPEAITATPVLLTPTLTADPTAQVHELHDHAQPQHALLQSSSGRPQRKRGRINLQELSKCICGETENTPEDQGNGNPPTVLQCKQKSCETQWVC